MKTSERGIFPTNIFTIYINLIAADNLFLISFNNCFLFDFFIVLSECLF